MSGDEHLIRGTVQTVLLDRRGFTAWLPLVVRPRRADEPELLRFDDRLYEGGGDSVILWSGEPRATVTKALEVAQRMAKRIAVLEATNVP